MSHIYEIRLIEFMQRVGASPIEMGERLQGLAERDVGHYLRKLYEEDPNRPFTIRMSNIGRPLCQLQMDQAGKKKVASDWNFPLRMMYGGVIEGVSVALMREAGINIEEEQTKVTLKLDNIDISGTLDLVIDGRVWDVKSASQYSYKEKFKSYESLKESDELGYLCQLYGYSKARALPPGGWIVVDKSSGEMKFLEVPDSWEADSDTAIQTMTDNATALINNTKFKRCFTDKPEFFKKKPTGNMVLDHPCIYCPFKYECWPNLQYLPIMNSTAYDKNYKYYTSTEKKSM